MGESVTEMLNSISRQIGQYLPNIAAAIGVLILGWIVAHILARVVRAAIKKTGVDTRIGNWLATDKSTDISKLAGKITYYLTMLFVFVAFFNVLDLPIVSAPLAQFLGEIFEYAPRVISAIALAVAGWAVATIARLGSRRGLEAINIDQRLANIGQDLSAVKNATSSAVSNALGTSATDGDELQLDEETDDELIAKMPRSHFAASRSDSLGFDEALIADSSDSTNLAKSIPDAIYWLILFLFLPAVFGALQMPGLMEPIQSMFQKALGYIPNIFGASIILAIGVFAAKIIRQVATNLAASFGADRLGKKLGLMSGSKTKISGILGVVAYATVLLPITVAALNALNIDAVTQPASAVLQKITSAFPGLIGGGVVVAISFFIAKLVAGVVSELLAGVGADEFPSRFGLKSPSSQPLSKFVGSAVLVIIMLLAVMQALPMMGMSMLADHLSTIIGFGAQVLVGLAILALGLYLGTLASKFVAESGVPNASKLALAAKVAIVVFAGAIGLERMGLSSSIVNVAFGTLLGGLGIAVAIAFGWGGRDAAKRIVDRYVG